MGPDEHERDDLVAQALGSLPVPEHRPGFWERLDGAFDEIDHEHTTETTTAMQGTQTPANPSAPGTGEVHDLDAVRQSPRRRARLGRRYQMLSAAAAVAVVIAGVGVLNSNSGNGKADEPIAAARLGDPEAEAQFEAVAAFFEAGEEGDLDGLWSLLGPLSKKQFGEKEKLQPMLDGRQEDGDQSVFDPRDKWRSYPLGGDPDGAVVAATRNDGADELVLPVVRDDGHWLVEYGVSGSIETTPELVSRSARQPGEPIDIPIEIAADQRGDIYGRIDGKGDFVKLDKLGNGLFRFDQKLSDLPDGNHYLETVMRGPDWFFITSVVLTGDDPSTTATTAQGVPVPEPVDVTQQWSQAIADNDADRAWDLMGPDSQAYLTAQGGWEAMVQEMQEGSHAAWSRHRDAQWAVSAMPGDAGAALVTVAGTIELEGSQEYRFAAYPTINLNGTWKVEPFAFGPGDTDAEWITPEPGQNGLGGIEPGATIEVLAPGTASISVDGGPLQPMTAGRDKRWTHKPAKPFSNGTHSVVVVTRGDGFFTASPGEFAVEG